MVIISCIISILVRRLCKRTNKNAEKLDNPTKIVKREVFAKSHLDFFFEIMYFKNTKTFSQHEGRAEYGIHERHCAALRRFRGYGE